MPDQQNVSVRSAPFAPRSISIRIYPHGGLESTEILEELCLQAQLASEHSFDGVMVSEHHGGFAGYIPNPLQVTSWMLEKMPNGWVAPCPLLLPLRPVAMLAEEVAWLEARFPGRVGIGVAPGALDLDFTVMEIDKASAMPRFRAGLPKLAALLRGDELGELSGDRALNACVRAPITVISTAMSEPAVVRAARCGTGILFDGATELSRIKELTEAYREAGGVGPRILIRRAWLGDPPQEAFARQSATYRSYSSAAAQKHWQDASLIARSDPLDLAQTLAAAVAQSGTDSLNIRIHVPDVTPAQAREQIRAIGTDVLPALRDELWDLALR